MSKSSFLVLGSASAIFSTLVILSLFCAQSVDGFDAVWNTKTVTVQNDIDPNIAFKIHCRSSEDDFGEHMLYHRQSFYWRFNVNFLQTTKFKCDSSWYDPNEKKNHKMEFYAYYTKKHYNRYCLDDCFWSIRRDGGYYGKSEDDKEFPFKKMFSYE
ncbi:hypothetical protein MKX03_013982 [Papaver bracteatum]|nr:hypothetical protein MKX03_013982 [Papaver bracteatum]